MSNRCCEVFVVGGVIYFVAMGETDGPLVWKSVVGNVPTSAPPEEMGALALSALDAFSRERVPFTEGIARGNELFEKLNAKSRKAFFARKPKLILVDEEPGDAVAVTPTMLVGREYRHEVGSRLVCPKRAIEVGRAIRNFA